jgi:hypothetical protein
MIIESESLLEIFDFYSPIKKAPMINLDEPKKIVIINEKK